MSINESVGRSRSVGLVFKEKLLPISKVPEALGFKPAKTGVAGKTPAYQIKQHLCIQLFSLLGAAVALLFLLVYTTGSDLHTVQVQSNEQIQIQENQERLTRVSGAEEALESESFQEQNLDYLARMRSQNARMFMLMNTFETKMNITLGKLNETILAQPTLLALLKPLVAEIRSGVQSHLSKMDYRMKEVRKTLDIDTDASRTRLKKVDAKVEKLLSITPAPTPRLGGIKLRGITQHQTKVNSWVEQTQKGSGTKKLKGHTHKLFKPSNAMKKKNLRIVLQKFSEMKTKGLLNSMPKAKSRGKRSSQAEVKSLKAKNTEHSGKSGGVGAKREKLLVQNRKIQQRLQNVFTKVHTLPKVTLQPAREEQWKAILTTYRKLLKKADGSRQTTALLKKLSAEMTQVLLSAEGQRVLRAVYDSKKKTGELRMSVKIDEAYLKSKIKLHPYHLFQMLNRLVDFTKGRGKVFEVEKQLLWDNINMFQAWVALRRLMKEHLAPRPNWR